MPIEVTMPRLSDTMQQGTVVKWNVKEGQKVSSGDVIADIETDKATMELQSFDDGTVARLTAAEGQTVPVGTVIAVLAAQGESVEDARKAGSANGARGAERAQHDAKQAESHGVGFSEKEAVGAATLTRESQPAAGARAEPARRETGDGPARDGGRIFASPLARKMADEHGLDLTEIKGTGPSGRIVRKDIEAALSAPQAPQARKPGAPAPAPRAPELALPPAGAALEPRTVPLSNMRRVIARRLVESKQTVPHYQVTVEVDMDALVSLRSTLNDQLASQGVKLSVNDFIVRACALAMHQHPFVNSRWVEQGNDAAIEVLGEVNIGIAIALPEERGGGLVVGVVRNADHLGLRSISHQSKALADKARAKGLAPNEMEGATFTISNLGMFGVEHFTAIINPPNVCILAVGAAIQKPVVKDGQLAVGHRMAMTMSSDHRIVDGAMAAQYLNTVKTLLQQPAALLV